ncbi:HET-domain-containing protein [Aspergillus piperis CBS 112811]|uniref:HET-domain-containing protein n=1 Tax=Aspergillus piperis CBS 112811 TaxID=1448313 RepID=A0A8G1VRE4_9EURO|nr:HET-domain-containing protein [Aspergillus piperis CBS 112811]RAH62841.1 HET-domain-containing protein [Aspergillus piperis CBS 112811]
MSPELARNPVLTGPAFTYTELPRESPHPTTRMIRLLPNKDKAAQIECEIFNYEFILDTSGGDSHIYEALSYVWGSGTSSRTIILNGCRFPVTENLYVALSYLRNRQLERIVWVDAICINQSNRDEKAQQIPLMREIYAQAQHVIVWLGEAYDDGDRALEGLRCLVEGQDIDIEGCGKLCVNLFQRAWFRRIWVLQEVGVARFIYIMCGSVQINGHILCEGLNKLSLPPKDQDMIGPVVFLIKGALFRPRYEPMSRGTLTIGELVGMYCFHDATEQHDKVYALLGLSADPMTPALTPNYDFPWNKVFKQVTNHIFPKCSVETWPESDIAIIRGMGWALGHICSVRHVSDFGQQKVKMYLNDTAQLVGYQSDWETDWELQTFAQFFEPGDIVFLLHGASRPSIIRLCRDHFRIITPAVTLRKRRPRESLEGTSRGWHTPGGFFDILLAWRIPLNNDTRSQKWPETELPDMVPAYQEQSFEAEYRRSNITRIMVGVAMEALALEKPENEDIAHLLVSSGTDNTTASKLTKASGEDIRSSSDKILQSFFQSEQDDVSISQDMVKAVAENYGPCGYIIMELLFQLQGSSLPISEEVIEAAAGNFGKYGDQVMKAIYRHRGEFFPISEEVVKAAAGNTGRKATKILKLLFKAQGEAIPISGEVLKAAAANRSTHGFEILKIIVHHRGQNLPVSEDVIINAIENDEWGYDNIHYLFECCDRKVPLFEELVKAAAERDVTFLRLLLEQGEESLLVSEETVKAAAGCVTGNESLKLLFQYGEKSIPISEEVIKVAAGNEMYENRILEVLFQYAEGSLSISEEVVKTAAQNEGSGTAIMKFLFQQKGDKLPVTEEVVKAAAGNEGCGHDIIELLLQQKKRSGLPVTEEVVKAAAGNMRRGFVIMGFLFQQKGDKLPVTEEVVKTAAGNPWYGYLIVDLILRVRGNNLPVTEEPLEAAENTRCRATILEILQPKRSLQTTVTESPEVPEISESAESSDSPESLEDPPSSESPESSESSLSSDELDEED